MKYLTQRNNKWSNKFQLGALTIIFLAMIFADIAVNLVKQFQSMSILAIRYNRQQGTASMSKSKTVIFGIEIMRKKGFSLLKR